MGVNLAPVFPPTSLLLGDVHGGQIQHFEKTIIRKTVGLKVENLLYFDPWDNMDVDYLKKPRKWEASSIGKFMIWIGPTSSVFDIKKKRKRLKQTKDLNQSKRKIPKK